ncbi:hypothetical protein BDF14DRAFT_1808411 [Spinellus fusiger]|nr:hypothetical protein BDF14DRAFT_1808411 [Spinellus fusiger]
MYESERMNLILNITRSLSLTVWIFRQYLSGVLLNRAINLHMFSIIFSLSVLYIYSFNSFCFILLNLFYSTLLFYSLLLKYHRITNKSNAKIVYIIHHISLND